MMIAEKNLPTDDAAKLILASKQYTYWAVFKLQLTNIDN